VSSYFLYTVKYIEEKITKEKEKRERERKQE
jgi:hypothetical protein